MKDRPAAGDPAHDSQIIGSATSKVKIISRLLEPAQR